MKLTDNRQLTDTGLGRGGWPQLKKSRFVLPGKWMCLQFKIGSTNQHWRTVMGKLAVSQQNNCGKCLWKGSGKTVHEALEKGVVGRQWIYRLVRETTQITKKVKNPLLNIVELQALWCIFTRCPRNISFLIYLIAMKNMTIKRIRFIRIIVSLNFIFFLHTLLIIYCNLFAIRIW